MTATPHLASVSTCFTALEFNVLSTQSNGANTGVMTFKQISYFFHDLSNTHEGSSQQIYKYGSPAAISRADVGLSTVFALSDRADLGTVRHSQISAAHDLHSTPRVTPR